MSISVTGLPVPLNIGFLLASKVEEWTPGYERPDLSCSAVPEAPGAMGSMGSWRAGSALEASAEAVVRFVPAPVVVLVGSELEGQSQRQVEALLTVLVPPHLFVP